MSHPVLPLLPAQARSIGASAGLLEWLEGGVVFVFGLATFDYAASDAAGRRMAAVQLVRSKIATATEVASAFAVSQATLWRWVGSFKTDEVVGLSAMSPARGVRANCSDSWRTVEQTPMHGPSFKGACLVTSSRSREAPPPEVGPDSVPATCP